jgi:hypothetical protein
MMVNSPVQGVAIIDADTYGGICSHQCPINLAFLKAVTNADGSANAER